MDVNEYVSQHTYAMQLKLTVTWTDSRLAYEDLKSDENMNTLTPSEIREIWMPTLLFTNTKNKQEANFKNESSFATIKIKKGK